MAGRIAYYGGIVTNGLVLDLDAAKKDSYPGTGTAWNDISGNRNNGTLTNGPTFSSNNGGSIVFDGVDDYVNIPNTNSLVMTTTNQVTVDVWVYPIGDGISSTREFLNKRNDDGSTFVSYGVSWQSIDGGATNRVFCRLGFTDNTVSDLTSTNQNKNVWFNITETFNGTLHSLYINGIINASSSVSGKTIKDTGASVTLGSYNGSTEFINGRIASGKIYNRGLTASEVLQNYNALKGRYGL
jgi:hypothetical protein